MRQHETLPGPGPGRSSALNGAAGVRPVEQMVDAAIERIEREREARDHDARDHEHTASGASEHALAVPSANDARLPTRLRWKGLDVSDEFRNYAERVARGEDLPPFEGRVLAEPNPAFPFGPASVERGAAHERATQGRTSRAIVWSSAAIVLGLLGWSLAQRGDAERPSPEVSSAPFVAEAVAPAATSPHDVVEIPALAATAAPRTPAALESPAPGATEGASQSPVGADAVSTDPVAAAAVPQGPSAEGAAPSTPAVEPPPAPVTAAAPPRAPASVPAPSAWAPAASAAPPAAQPSAPQGATAVALTKALAEDDFGIMPAGDGAGVSVPVATASPAAKSVASVNGSVGDLARAGQAPAGPARKEPGSESSAKGSLLVETPSF